MVIKLWLYCRPSIVCPANLSLHQYCCSIVGNAVAMAYEDVTIREGIGRTMASSLQRHTITTEERGSSSYGHVLAGTVKIWAGNGAAPTYSHPICALLATAAIVPADEEEIPAVLMEYEGCLDGVLASIFRSRIATMRTIVAPSAGNGLGNADSMHGAVKGNYLNTIPETSESHPWPSSGISTNVGIYGIPVVAFLPAGDDASLISPFWRRERG